MLDIATHFPYKTSATKQRGLPIEHIHLCLFLSNQTNPSPAPPTQAPGTNTKKNCYLLAAMIRKAC